MLTEFEARTRLLARIDPLNEEPVPLGKSLARFLSRDVRSTIAIPSFDNSQVDGYAVHSSNATAGTRLHVVGEHAAGVGQTLAVGAGAALRIFTGAPMPLGADAVVMQEDVTRDGDHIVLNETTTPGEHVRRTGSDLCRGQFIARRGERITPALIGLFASQGLVEVGVHRQPRIGILSTGDELIAPGTALLPGQIYNSNGPMLAAMLAQLGFADVTVRHCADTLNATTDALNHLMFSSDAVIISGGVSVGDHDHVKPALTALGLVPDFWRVKVKPGKPFLFAWREGSLPASIFGLPGNPVSAFVTFHLFVRPALMKMMGGNEELPTIIARLTTTVSNDGDRPHYVRGQFMNGDFTPTGLQQSHALFGLSRCNALLRVAEGESISSGETRAVTLL